MNRSLKKLERTVKEVDIFGQGISLQFERDKEKHKTYLGSLLTVIVIIITATYAIKRMQIMLDYGDTVYLSSYETSIVSSNETLKYDETNFILNF